jgi:acetolactate synthase-1/2/3 large subunit
VRAVALTLGRVLEDERCLLVEEAVTNVPAVSELVPRSEPGTLFSSGGPGLGWSPGASVGVKLARPERPVVAVLGDGSFMFGVPTAALSLAAEALAPVVLVVLNNQGYRASRRPVLQLFPDGASVKRGEVIGTRFARAPDFVDLARACGAYGERTDGAAGLADALGRALAASQQGVSAVIDVRIEQS